MNPHLRPKGLITLINRDSTSIYSGMFPGLVAGNYQLEDSSIDLRKLASCAGVSFIVGEINALDLNEKRVFINSRSSIGFSKLSIDVGSETAVDAKTLKILLDKSLSVPIKPFKKSFQWIKNLDLDSASKTPLTVIGSGLAAIEIVFALKKRWPSRRIRLRAHLNKLDKHFKHALNRAKIEILDETALIFGPALLCTGNQAPQWLKASGLEVNKSGRILTKATFEVLGQSDIFAVGDCGLLENNNRSPSGVWAVRAAKPLAKNIERSFAGESLISWHPQKNALQLVGGYANPYKKNAVFVWGPFLFGFKNIFWKLKEILDKSFIEKFKNLATMENEQSMDGCRGCAAKISATCLNSALKASDLQELQSSPEDAALVASFAKGLSWFQSVDGFPALISDPWLNARLTSLHACSDLWAKGSSVASAQALITLPAVSPTLQEEMLIQCITGIKSALEPQGAKLIGGHTFESRAPVPFSITMGIEVSLSVNGFIAENEGEPLNKFGLQLGDQILISKGLGSGVIFAAAMEENCHSHYLDQALFELSQSQHILLDDIRSNCLNSSQKSLVHACTDITGFGLLGHLGEMIHATNIDRLKACLPLLKVNLFADRIPSLNGAKKLLRYGYHSTLAPANRTAWSLLNQGKNSSGLIELLFDSICSDNEEVEIIKELLIDPQTCGPLIISCNSDLAKKLTINSSWTRIGIVDLY